MVEWAFTSIASDVTVFIGTHLYAYSFVMTFFIILFCL